jgi:hypothetical protein
MQLFKYKNQSEVLVWFVETHVVFCVDCEVACVNVVPFHDLFEYFWLVYRALLHEVDDLVLNRVVVVLVMVQLYLQFILKLS